MGETGETVHTQPGPVGLSLVGAESPRSGIYDLHAGGHFYFNTKPVMLVCSRKMAAKQVPANEVAYIFVFQQLLSS